MVDFMISQDSPRSRVEGSYRWRRITVAALGLAVVGVSGCQPTSSATPAASGSAAASSAATSPASLPSATSSSNAPVDSTPESTNASVPALTATTVRTLTGTGAAPFDQGRQLQAPPGWTVTVWARVPAARLLAWAPDGQLLVSRPEAGQVVALVPGQGNAAPTQHTLVSGLTQPHGLAFAGNTLYVAESDKVDTFAYANGALTAKKVVISGLPDAKTVTVDGSYAHPLKSVAIGPDGSVYVSVGSSGNISAEDRDASLQRATILRTPAGGGTPTVFARGVRNGTGLAIDPVGAVWTAVNNRDNVEYPYAGANQGKVIQSYVNDHPLEPLAKLTQGRDLGWPYCNPDPDVTAGAASSALNYTNRPFIRDIDSNTDGKKLDCAALPRVEQGLGAHSAPLGLSFTSTPGLAGGYGQGALVGVHGSWNRQPPRAPEVSFFAWRDGALGPQQTLLTGFQLADGSRWGRPVMAVQGPDKAVYVSDDQAGAIYRITTP